MAPPHFQGSLGGGTSCARQPTKDVVKESIATGISSIFPTRCEKSQATTQKGQAQGQEGRAARGEGQRGGQEGAKGQATSLAPCGSVFWCFFWGGPASAVVVRLLVIGFREFPSGENQCTLQGFGLQGWLEAELCLRGEPGGALFVHSPKAPPIVLPNTGVKADVFLQCLTTLVIA